MLMFIRYCLDVLCPFDDTALPCKGCSKVISEAELGEIVILQRLCKMVQGHVIVNGVVYSVVVNKP